MNHQKGIIYCRVSSNQQVDGASLDNQKEACLDYADRENIEIVDIYVEQGESATASDRTEFIKALDRCKEDDSIDAFIVWKVDRFARNTQDHFGVRAKLRKHNTNLYSVSEPIKDTPQGKLMETVLAGFAEFENNIRQERCNGGMKSQLKDGLWIWPAPFGYIKPEKEGRRVNKPPYKDKKRAPLIKKGAKRYVQGDITMKELAEVSTDWGLRTSTGKPMRKQLWDRIFKNRFYTGIIVDPWSDEIYEGKHEAIIPQRLFEKVQKNKKCTLEQ
jgi:DNA invertase Pin-like site-specific DNA recombinase